MNVLAAVGALGVGAGAWVVTPLVSMARRGAVEQQVVEGWREEAERVAAVRRARQRAAIVASIPAPRAQTHDQRRSPVAG